MPYLTAELSEGRSFHHNTIDNLKGSAPSTICFMNVINVTEV